MTLHLGRRGVQGAGDSGAARLKVVLLTVTSLRLDERFFGRKGRAKPDRAE